MANRNINIDLHTGQTAAPRLPLTPQEIAARRAGMYGEGFAKACLVLGIGLAIVSYPFLLRFFWSMDGDWHEAASWVIAVALYVGSTAVLPSMAQIHACRYPERSRLIWIGWGVLVILCLVAIAIQVTSSMGAIAGDQEAARAAAMVKGLLFGAGPAAGGLLCSLSVTGHAESYRLAYGDIGMPMAAAQAKPATEALPAPGDAFPFWAEGRLREGPELRVQAEKAYGDYCETCDLNSIPPMNQKAFGNLLTARMQNSGGRVTKQKIDGKNWYVGWGLPEESRALQYAEFERIEGPR